MSTPTHLAALDDIRDALNWLRETVAGLPVEALDWPPGPGTNSIAVLGRHALSSTVFWASAGTGQDPSHRAYVQQERLPAFESRGMTARSLSAEIDETLKKLDNILREGEEAHLRSMLSWPESDATPRTGAGCLVHAASHLREHVGQAALTRDLWLARATEA